MAKKQFDTKTATSKFFTGAAGEEKPQETPEIQTAHNTDTADSTHNTQENPYEQERHPNGAKFPRRQGRPKKQPEERKRAFRYNLLLDADLNQYLHEIVWIKRSNMTQYVNDLIRADYEAYLKDCKEKGKDPFEGWENPNET